MSVITRFSFVALSLLFTSAVMRACDLCGCYTPQLEAFPQTSAETPFGQPAGLPLQSFSDRFYGAIGEQFTYFGTVQIDGREVNNPSHQFESSSITQLVAGYSLDSRFALQINVPLIYRYFQRPAGFAIDRGTEAGLGDISLLLKSVLYHYISPPSARGKEPDFTASVLLLTGIKLPTGDSSRIKEEFNEVEIPGAPVSGIHGHDLTLGTGSFDGIFGSQGSLRYGNFFFEADAQFTLRGDGLHQYHFANDFSWSGGPGYYFVRRSDIIFGVQFVVSGEHKDVDRFRGEAAGDTGITSISVGPHVVASYKKISAEVGIDLPVSIENTALQVVPDYRIRAGLSLRF